jgi:hypothetical protein
MYRHSLFFDKDILGEKSANPHRFNYGKFKAESPFRKYLNLSGLRREKTQSLLYYTTIILLGKETRIALFRSVVLETILQ